MKRQKKQKIGQEHQQGLLALLMLLPILANILMFW